MASQEELIVKISADIDDLKKDLKQAGEETEKFGKKGGKSGDALNKGFTKAKAGAAALAVAVVAAGTAIVSLTKNVIENSREQRLWANRLNVSTVEFGKLTAIARRFGAETDDVGDAIKDLNERIADAARGNKTYEEALKLVGLASKDLIDLPVEEQFIKVADAIGKLNNAGDQNFVTAELMADAGFRLLEVFRLGEEGIRKMGKEVLETNEALDAFEQKQIQAAEKSLNRLDQAFTSFSNTLAVTFSGAIEGATEAMIALNKVLSDSEQEQIEKLSDKYVRLATRLAALSPRNVRHRREIKNIRKEMKLLDEQLRAIGQSYDPLGESIDSFSQFAPEFGPENRETPLLPALPGVEQGAAPFLFSEDVLSQQMDTYQQFLLDKEEADEAARMKEIEEVAAHLQKMKDLEEKNKIERDRISKQMKDGEKAATSKFFSDMTSLMSSGSRKLFEIGKAAAIAEVAIEIPKNAEKAFGWGVRIGGPPVGAAFAAASVAAGLTRLQQIQSTTMGGGGGVGGVGAAGATAGGEGGAEVINQTNVDVSLQGSTFSRDDVRGLINEINEQADDNFVVRAN